MGPTYVLQLLISEKPKLANNSTATEAREKWTDLESLEFFYVDFSKFKKIKFYLIK